MKFAAKQNPKNKTTNKASQKKRNTRPKQKTTISLTTRQQHINALLIFKH
jgi:hypothetical protein